MEKISLNFGLSPEIKNFAALADHYDLVLCDVWGVIHNGEKAWPEAIDALIRFRKKGGRVVLVTNAPIPHEGVIPILDQFGVNRRAYDAIVSSGDATLAMMAARKNQKAFHLGPERDTLLFETFAKRFSLADPRAKLEQAQYCVCTGLWRDDDDPRDYVWLLKEMAAKNMTMICANPDIVVHVGDDLIFCAGVLARDYATLGGPVEQAGKPFEIFYQTALTAASKESSLNKARILAIGDAFATDVRGAAGQGFNSLFISGGIHRAALHTPEWNEDSYQALCGEYNVRPTAHAPALKW